MVPIWGRQNGQSIGYEVNRFIERFEDICQEHLKKGRAKAFAFLFYDFSDGDLNSVIHDLGVFAELDRLSNNDLSIFYFHSGSELQFERFNRYFQATLGVRGQAILPCVVFFKMEGDRVGDVETVCLDNANLISGFHELHDVISDYVSTGIQPERKFVALKRLTAVGKFVGLEVFRALLKDGIGMLSK